MGKKLDTSTIEENNADILTSISKGSIGMIPVFGPYIAELYESIGVR